MPGEAALLALLLSVLLPSLSEASSNCIKSTLAQSLAGFLDPSVWSGGAGFVLDKEGPPMMLFQNESSSSLKQAAVEAALLASGILLQSAMILNYPKGAYYLGI